MIRFEDDYIIDINKFRPLKRIGFGSFSSVYKVKEIETGQIYAAKESREELIENTDEFLQYTNQISILSQISHPCIVKFYGFSKKNFDNENRPVIITEYMTNGSLDYVIKNESLSLATLEWTLTKKLINIYGIAKGMKFLHSKKILHRDLKPSNVLEDENFYPKICDFGVANLGTDTVIENSFVGTPIFMAPETVKSGETSYSSDVFSFAMTVYNFMTAMPPLISEEMSAFKHQMMLLEGKRPPFKVEIPTAYKRLIEDCWEQDPNKRPSFEQIVDILENDKSFITSEVEEDEFLDYIDIVNEIENDKTEDKVYDKKTESKIENKTDDDDDEDGVVVEDSHKPFLINVKNLNLKNFNKLEKVGHGYSGEVYKITSKTTEAVYAAKVIIDKIYESMRNTSKANRLQREVSILSEVSHPSIMKFYGYSSIDFIGGYRPVIITEYLGNGSLDDIIEIQRNKIKADSIWNDTMNLISIYGVAKSMLYLHSKGIIHRDLKPGNVLIDEFLFPKLADFGFSKHLQQKLKTDEEMVNLILSGVLGTPAFIAPEISNDAEYTKAGDVYAFGMFVYELITLEIPFKGLNNAQIAYSISKEKRPAFKKSIPNHYKELIKDCWSQEPSKRPTFEEIVNELENDKKFVQKNIDKKFYYNYIKFIKEQEIKGTLFNKQKYSFQKYSLEEMQREIKENKSILIGEGSISIGDFINKSEILRNNFSCFYEVSNKQTGQLFSAEISNLPIANLSKKEKQNLSIEVGILTKLKHPSIQQIIGYSLFDFENQPNPVIIREHSTNISLFEIISKERKGEKIKKWNETKKLINIFGIASGMSYLHSHNVLHHELNSRNIFLDSELNPKITNFGYLIKPQNSSRSSNHSMKMDNIIPYFIAPEILLSSKNEDENKNTKSSDVYSFAFVVYEILTSEVPFENIKDQKQFFNEIVNKISRPSLNKVSKRYKELISSCWSQNPRERPDFTSIVRELKTDKNFITDKIIEKEFRKFIEIIEHCD